MADNNVIDSLELKVRGDANNAIANLSKLQTQLRHTAKSIGSVQAAVEGLNRVDLSFKKLGQVNIGNLSAAITQLERLSKINLKNIDGKKLDLNVSITGASEATRQIEAMKKAANSINPRQFSDKLIKAFNIQDKGAVKTIRDQYRQIMESLRTTGKVDTNAAHTIYDTLIQHGEVAKVKLNGQMNNLETRYREFLQYISKQPFFTTDMGGAFGETKGEINQTLLQSGLKNLFTQNANAARDLDGIWEELIDDVHGFGDVMSSVLSREDYMGALATELGAAETQSTLLAKAILGVRDALSTVSLKDVSEENLFGATMPYYENSLAIDKQFKQNVEKNMAESVGKIPLDIVLDENSVSAQIQKMIYNASKKRYDFPIKVKVEQSDLRNQFTEIIKGLDVKNLGDITEKLKDTTKSIAEMKSVDLKASGVNSFVGSIRKLSDVDLSKFDATPLTSLVEVISAISGAGKIEAGIVRLVAALGKLASAGGATRTTAKFLPALGDAVKTAAGHLASVGGLPDRIIAFTNALGLLANAGNKTGTTATNLSALGTALKALMSDLQGSPQVSENLIRMTEALGQLASSGGKAGTAARSVGKSLEKVGDKRVSDANVRLNAIVSAMKNLMDVFQKAGGYVMRGAQKIVSSLKQIKSAGNGLQTATTSIRNMIGAMIGFRGIYGLGNLIKETITLGADLTEIDHIVESVFGNMSSVVDSWAKGAIEQFGIAEHSAKRYAGVLSSMFQASQIGYMDAGKMSMDLVGLAGDLSAFYNIDTETAFNKIRSGMAGMVRPLRDLGIDLTAATLDEFRLAQGIETSYSQMSQAEKVMLRYKYLMENTNLQQGDFQRTSLSLANSLRTLKAYAQAVGTQIGVGLGSALRHVIILLNTMMKYVLKAATAFATFMQTIFGKYKGGASGIAMEGLGDAVDYADDLGDAANNAAGGLGDAADNAKQLEKDLSVLPFDQLNQLNKDRQEVSSGSGSGGSGSGTGGAGAGGITDGLLDWEGDLEEALEGSALRAKINAWATQLKKDFLMHDWEALGADIAGGLNRGLQKVYDLLDPKKASEKLDPWLNAFTTTFNSFVKNFDFNLLGRTVGRGINNVVHILNTTIEGIEWSTLGGQIASGVNGLFDEVDWDGLGTLVGNKFMMFWNTLNGFVNGFDWDGLGTSVSTFFNGVFDTINFETIADTISTGLNGAFTSLASFTAGFDWTNLVHKLARGINTFIRNFDWKGNGQKLNDFLQHLADALVDFVDEVEWEELGRSIADFLAEIEWIKFLKKVADAMLKALGGLLKGLFSEPEGKVATGIIVGLALLKFSHSSFGLFAGNLVRAITGKTVKDTLTDGFKTLFSKSVTEAAGSQTVTTAAETAGTSVVAKIGKGVSAFASTSVGTGLGIAALAIGATEAAVAISKVRDEARGGNGVLTEMGMIVDDVTNYLSEHNRIAKKDADALFMLKEQAENSGKSSREFGDEFVQALAGMSISSEQLTNILNELGINLDTSGEAFTGLAEAAAAADNSIVIAAGSINMSGTDINNAIDDVWTAVNNLANAADGGANLDLIASAFNNTITSANDAQTVYQSVRQMLGDMGYDVNEFDKYLAEMGYEFTDSAQIVSASADSIESAVEDVTSSGKDMNTTISDMQNAIREFAEEAGIAPDVLNILMESFDNSRIGAENAQEVYNHAKETLEGFGFSVDDFNEILRTMGYEFDGNSIIVSDASNDMKTNIESDVEDIIASENDLVDTTSSAMNSVSGFMNGTKDSGDAMQKGISESTSLAAGAFGLLSSATEELAKNTESNMNDTKTAISDYKTDSNESLDKNKEKFKDWQSISVGEMVSMITKMGTVVQASQTMSESVETNLETMVGNFQEAFASIGTGTLGMVEQLASALVEMENSVSSSMENIHNIMSIDLTQDGYNAAQSFANGFRSVYIPTPHMYVSDLNYVSLGNGGMYIPSFGIAWYKKGGLFMGGDGQMIGIAESGRDEAVLPLEDRRAMARIGSAIADASGNNGGMNNDMADRIAEKIADVLINTRSDDNNTPMNYVELKVDSEVLARAVTKGQQKLDYRNNPTAQIAY